MAYDFLVFVGRFQPFHCGHCYVINKALEISKNVIIIVGSCDAKRENKNPYSYIERVRMLRSSFNKDDNSRIFCVPVSDYPDDNDWVVRVKEGVSDIARDKSVGIIGHDKDSSSFYLNLFEEWDLVLLDNFKGLSATEIREANYAGENLSKYVEDGLLSQKVLDIMVEIKLKGGI